MTIEAVIRVAAVHLPLGDHICERLQALGISLTPPEQSLSDLSLTFVRKLKENSSKLSRTEEWQLSRAIEILMAHEAAD